MKPNGISVPKEGRVTLSAFRGEIKQGPQCKLFKVVNSVGRTTENLSDVPGKLKN